MLLDDCLFRLRLVPAVFDGCPSKSMSSLSVSGEEEELLEEKLIAIGVFVVVVAAAVDVGSGTVVVADPGTTAGIVALRLWGNMEEVEVGIRTDEIGIGIPIETGATSKVIILVLVFVTVVTGIGREADTLLVVAVDEWRASSWLKNL